MRTHIHKKTHFRSCTILFKSTEPKKSIFTRIYTADSRNKIEIDFPSYFLRSFILFRRPNFHWPIQHALPFCGGLVALIPIVYFFFFHFYITIFIHIYSLSSPLTTVILIVVVRLAICDSQLIQMCIHSRTRNEVELNYLFIHSKTKLKTFGCCFYSRYCLRFCSGFRLIQFCLKLL